MITDKELNNWIRGEWIALKGCDTETIQLIAKEILALREELAAALAAIEEVVRCPTGSLRPKLLAQTFLARYSQPVENEGSEE